MARKFRKYGQVESIEAHLQYTPTYYVNYKKEDDGANALIELIHKEGVARVVATMERNVNVSKSVTMELCFKEEGRKTKNYNKEKTPRWLFCTFKEKKKELHERQDIFKATTTKG